MSYQKIVQEDRRLVILRTLAEAPAYTANAYVLAQAMQVNGHAVALDVVKTELAWLAEQGLVAVESLPPLLVASLSERGLDVSAGRATAPGVKRPHPGH